MKQKTNNGKYKKKKNKNGNLTKEMLEAMKELQEQQLRTSKAIADLAGAKSDEEPHKKFGSLITMIRSEKHKETNEKIIETSKRSSENER